MKNDFLHYCQGRTKSKELNGTDSPPATDSSRRLPPLFLWKISHSWCWVLTPSGNTVSKNNCNVLTKSSPSHKKIPSTEESFILHPKRCSDKTHALVRRDLDVGCRCTELGLRLSQRFLVVSKYSLKEAFPPPFGPSRPSRIHHPPFFFWVTLPPWPLGGAGNTACEDTGYPSITVTGVKNNPPEKSLGRERLMEDLALRLIIINQFLFTLGSWRGLPVFFFPQFFLIYSSSFLHPFRSGVFER